MIFLNFYKNVGSYFTSLLQVQGDKSTRKLFLVVEISAIITISCIRYPLLAHKHSYSRVSWVMNEIAILTNCFQ